MGSLDKPGWRVKAYAGKKLDESDFEEARAWGERLGVDGYEELLELLRRSPITSPERKAHIKRWGSRYGLALQERAGLDVVYDGEQQRSEMYAWAIQHADGFEWRGSVRAFDNKYYSKAAVTGAIGMRSPFHDDEFAFLKDVASAELKVPVTGAYTIADWSFDEYYLRDHDLTEPHSARRSTSPGARPNRTSSTCSWKASTRASPAWTPCSQRICVSPTTTSSSRGSRR
jgi:5-methyltetrahydropteroyltriglutamate--homocysteine methyltransferase